MVIGGSGDDGAQQPAPSMNRANYGGAEYEKLRIRVRSIAGIEQIALSGVADREVTCLPEPLTPANGFS
jgi:hypothetical protein